MTEQPHMIEVHIKLINLNQQTLAFHGQLYGEPDEVQKTMTFMARNNYEKCKSVSDESNCLQWLFGSEYFWAK